MHSNHVMCIVGVSRWVRFVKGGEILSTEGQPLPFAPPLNEALTLWIAYMQSLLGLSLPACLKFGQPHYSASSAH